MDNRLTWAAFFKELPPRPHPFSTSFLYGPFSDSVRNTAAIVRRGTVEYPTTHRQIESSVDGTLDDLAPNKPPPDFAGPGTDLRPCGCVGARKWARDCGRVRVREGAVAVHK